MTWLWPDKALINARRIELGLSQDALSKQAKVGKTTIERLLGSGSRRATHTTLKRIAQVLELPLEDILLKTPIQDRSYTNTKKPPCRYAGSDLPQGLCEHLVGREAELALLDRAWADPTTHLISIIGMGGLGKTSLVNHWLAADGLDYRGAKTVFVWSFSAQGENDPQASTDEFIIKAWRCFCPDMCMPNHWLARAEHLAECISVERNLLVLDGLEVLQNPPGLAAGLIQSHEPIRTLLLRLSRDNQGLCIVTSRIELEDLRARRELTVPQLTLPPISEVDGIELLHRLGVSGSDRDLAQVVTKLWGHPLSLILLGRYLSQLDPNGDIGRWSCDFMPLADARSQSACDQIMQQYEAWLGDVAKLSILRLLALFDQTIELEMIEIFRQPPAITGLTDQLIPLNEDEWMLTLSDLANSGLINFTRMDSRLGLELHPVVRSYFLRRFKAQLPLAWRDAHARLFTATLNSHAENPITYDELTPLYRAVRHGCEAGYYKRTFHEVVWKRLMQGFPAFSVHKFNAGELDMIAVARFFEDGQVHPDHTRIAHTHHLCNGRLFYWAGLVYRLNGRLDQAITLFQSAKEQFHRANNLVGEAASLAYASRCQLHRGRVADAVLSARGGVTIVDRDSAGFAKAVLEEGNIGPVLKGVFSLTDHIKTDKPPLSQRILFFPLADALHHAGQLKESQRLFEYTYRAGLPRALSTWDLIVGQDAMYYDLLLTLEHLDEVRGLIEQRLASLPANMAMSKALMQTLLHRSELVRLEQPDRIPELATALLQLGELLDYRTNYHTLRGLLELSAAARKLGEFDQALHIVERVMRLREAYNLGLLEVDLLLEQAALALARSDSHLALSRVIQAQRLIETNGYQLRQRTVAKLFKQIQALELCLD